MGKRGANHVESQLPETPNKRIKYDCQAVSSPVLEQSFILNKELVDGTVMTDIKKKKWRVGKPFGKGSFGEIFLASDDIKRAVTSANANYVVKIEPHSSGPLFVEIHCLLNAGRATEDLPLPPGMPEYIASGSHTFNKIRYRFLVLPRYKFDLHSVIKNRCIDEKNLLVIAVQTLDVLEHLHSKGYVHADIKAANMMIGSCPKGSVNDEYQCSDQEDDCMSDFEQSDSSRSMSNKSDSTNDGGQFSTPLLWSRPRVRNNVEFSGSNPIRSCRMSRKTSVYEEMLNYHYLRPHKKIDYSQYEDADDDFENKNSSRSKDDDLEANSYYNKVYSQKSTGVRQKLFSSSEGLSDSEDRIYLIDFGLALKYLDVNGQHKPFCMDERRAHDGTLEFTSRDAHMGAHSRRSDLECLGYNLIFWSQGWLPWEHEKLLTQPEQVHRVKEHFMTDINEMLKQVYGEKVPKYLGEFLEYVGDLAYPATPDYNYCRSIFLNALHKMGVKGKDFKIDVNLLKSNPKCIFKDEMKKQNKKVKNVKEMFNIRSLLPPGENGSTKVSPKNLRSKSDKIPKKQRKKFSWTDVLNSDPDQIAKQRAEKEFENEAETPVVVKYCGKPNYLILRLENRLKFKDRLETKEEEEVNSDNEIKPDVDNRKKKSLQIQRDDVKKFNGNGSNGHEQIRRRKSGLRRVIRVPSKCVPYRESLSRKRRSGNSEFSPTDESSCSSNLSLKESQTSMSSVSDEDSRDTTEYTPIKTRIKSRATAGVKKVLKRKLHRNIRTPRKAQRDDQLKRINTRSG